MTTAQDILDIFLDSSASSSNRAREVFKKQKSKKENNSSLRGEEPKGYDSVTPLGLTALNPQTAFVSNVTPATTSSREIVGITAQHVRTERGIKVSFSIQTQAVADGTFASLTAELKRHGRLRELKRYSGDSASFEQHYITTINLLKDLTPEEGRRVCCGRLHERGKRAAWFADMMVVGNLDTSGTVLERVYLYSGLEEYVIEMSEPLSERQVQSYHCAGIYGQIRTNAQAPTLATAARRTF